MKKRKRPINIFFPFSLQKLLFFLREYIVIHCIITIKMIFLLLDNWMFLDGMEQLVFIAEFLWRKKQDLKKIAILIHFTAKRASVNGQCEIIWIWIHCDWLHYYHKYWQPQGQQKLLGHSYEKGNPYDDILATKVADIVLGIIVGYLPIENSEWQSLFSTGQRHYIQFWRQIITENHQLIRESWK